MRRIPIAPSPPYYAFIRPDYTHTRRSLECLTNLRLYMIGKQVLIDDLDDDGLHILDNDANWAIFEHEMQIPSAVFYDRADLSVWESVIAENLPPPLNHTGMEFYFFSAFLLGGGATYGAQSVSGFPTFSDITDNDLHKAFGAVGGEPSFVSSDARLRRLGFILGDFITSYITPFNSDTFVYAVSLSASRYPTAEFIYDAIDGSATVSSGDIVVEIGTQSYEITVTAEDGVTINVYTVNLTFV